MLHINQVLTKDAKGKVVEKIKHYEEECVLIIYTDKSFTVVSMYNSEFTLNEDYILTQCYFRGTEREFYTSDIVEELVNSGCLDLEVLKELKEERVKAVRKSQEDRERQQYLKLKEKFENGNS